MLYIFGLLLFLININQETVLNLFGIEDPTNRNTFSEDKYALSNINNEEIEVFSNLSLDTIKLITERLWEKIEDGLTLADIEYILFFILFVRFIILGIRYNLKTSFYITCIGFFAGYLWYRHLIDLIVAYRVVLINLPFFGKLGMSAIELREFHRQAVLSDVKLGENIHWYNPGKLIYYAFTRGITDINAETGIRYYIDPISMIVSKLKEPNKSEILPLYYKIYNRIMPGIFESCSKFWNQLSGMAAYAVITRIGKRYCPYLIRWHWTFLLIIGLVEQIFIFFVYRIFYFQAFILIPQIETYQNANIEIQISILNGILACVVLAHIGFIIFAVLHAIWGQYFYFPFFTENTELHVGLRPTKSIYSGGNTAWQNSEEKEKNFNRFLPKFWYGFFGRGTKNTWQVNKIFGKFFKNIFKKLRKPF